MNPFALPLVNYRRFSKGISGFLFPVLLALTANAELIPPARLINWQPGVTVGVPGGIDRYLPGGANQRTNLIDVTQPPYNADRTGATNAAAAIQAAIDAAPSGSVIFLPAGTYRCDSTIYLSYSRDSITLRGAGAATIIVAGQTSIGISVGTASDYSWSWPTSGNTVTAGLSKESTTVSIGNTAEFAVGKMIHFSFDNDLAIPVLGVGGGNYLRHQMCIVTAKTATSLSFLPPLYDNYGGGTLAAKVNVAQLQTDYVGIEDLTVDYTNGAGTFGIQFEQCYGCWIKGVRVIKAANYGFALYDSSRCEIRRSYADQRKLEGSNGGGLFCNTSSACLVEDNIFYKFFPLIEINQGSSGNVFAYNLCEDSRVYGALGAGIDSNHGPHNSYNLYEGNVSPNLQCDGYFGGASSDTVFRNWFHASVIGDGNAGGVGIILNRFTRNYSLIGNVLGKSGLGVFFPYSFGNPNMGNGNHSGTAQLSTGNWWASWGTTPGPGGFQELDLDVEATTLRKANYSIPDAGIAAGDTALGNDTLPNSLFRTGKPSYFASLAWPPFNPSSPNAVSYDAIPAGYRYVHGIDPPVAGGGTDTTAPSVPTNPAAAASGATQIDLSWTASTDNVGVTGYLVERSQGAGSTTYMQIAAPAVGSFSDTGLTGATVYNYRVRAVDASGNSSSYSSVATATTANPPADTTAPTVPQNLVAVASGATQVNLSWSASTDNVGVMGYSVERSQGANSTNYTQVATATGTSYSDTGLSAATLYNYRLRAMDAAGNLSGYSSVTTATTATTGTTSPNSLVAAYAFNEGSGASVADTSGNSNTGTLFNSPSWVAGKSGSGYALSLDGSTQYVDLGSASSLNITGNITVSAWINASVFPPSGSFATIVEKGYDGANEGYYLRLNNAYGSLSLDWGSYASPTVNGTRIGNTLKTATWYHIAGTWDGSEWKLYVNGSNVASTTNSNAPASSSGKVSIGASDLVGSKSRFFSGVIDDVRIYNRALSQDEIQADMNTQLGSGGKAPPPPTSLRLITP